MNLGDDLMARILTYHELEQTVYELEKDLLEYKNAKASAVRVKELLERIFNAVPDHIALIDSHYRIQLANKSLADRLGYPPERLAGEFCYQYICKADGPPSSCLHARMLNDGKEHTAETYNQKFGTNLLVTSSPLYDDEGRLYGGVYVARDITTHLENEDAVGEFEEKKEKKPEVLG